MNLLFWIGFIILLTMLAPIFIYFCVKFGTVGYFEGKRFLSRKSNNNDCDDISH